MSGNLWPIFTDPIGGYPESGVNTEWYMDTGGTPPLNRKGDGIEDAFSFDYEPVSAVKVELGHVPVYSGYTVNPSSKEIIFDTPPDDGADIVFYYDREV